MEKNRQVDEQKEGKTYAVHGWAYRKENEEVNGRKGSKPNWITEGKRRQPTSSACGLVAALG